MLTRKVGQSFKIGPDITITIVRNGETQVRVGVEAPASYQVWRTESIQKQPPDDNT